MTEEVSTEPMTEEAGGQRAKRAEGPFADVDLAVTDRLIDTALGHLDVTPVELQATLFVAERVYADTLAGEVDWEAFRERLAGKEMADPREGPLGRVQAALGAVEQVLADSAVGAMTVTPTQLRAATWCFDLCRGARSRATTEEGWRRFAEAMMSKEEDER